MYCCSWLGGGGGGGGGGRGERGGAFAFEGGHCWMVVVVGWIWEMRDGIGKREDRVGSTVERVNGIVMWRWLDGEIMMMTMIMFQTRSTLRGG